MRAKAVFPVMLWVALAVAGCQPERDPNRNVEKIKEEIRDKKIKRLTDAQIVQAAYDRGKKIGEMVREKAQLGADRCGQPVTVSLEKPYNLIAESIQLLCGPLDSFTEKEKMVWDAYQHNANNDLPMEENIQKISDEQLVYTYPVSFGEGNEPKWGILRIVLSKKEVIRGM